MFDLLYCFIGLQLTVARILRKTKIFFELFNLKSTPMTENTPVDIDTLVRASPCWFAYIASRGRWRPARHLLKLEDALLEASAGGKRRLIVNMPPRHGKSEFISKFFPAWFLSRNPEKRIILTSYETSFAQSHGRQVRRLISEYGSQYFGVYLSDDKKAAGEFTLAGSAGSMICTGAGGAITGRGADLLIIDDPVKNDAEAGSPTYRDSVYEWFRATAFTRLEPGGMLVLLMTRWHEDDLAGRLLRDEPDKYRLLNFPAFAEEGDELNRKPGEPLWPERYNRDMLKEIRQTLGEYSFSALYMQKPAPASGGIFKRKHCRYFDEQPGHYVLEDGRSVLKSGVLVTAACDLAVTVGAKSDYTVLIVGGTTRDGDLLILDIIREKIEGAGHLDMLRRVYSRHRPALIGIEAVQYQISLVQAAAAEGLPVKKLVPFGDKLARALPAAAKMEAGKVFFRRNAPWLGELLDELLKFPNARRDDQVDAFAYLCDICMPVGKVMPKAAKRRKSGIFE